MKFDLPLMLKILSLSLIFSSTVTNANPVYSKGPGDSTRKGKIQALLQNRINEASSKNVDLTGVVRGSLNHDNIERTYAILVPPSLKEKKQLVPLVLVLHGGGGNANFAMKTSKFNEKAKKEGFIVAYPEGTGRFEGVLLTWNATHCCGSAMKGKVDDVGYISKLIDKLVKNYPVDPNRVYVTGMSNGGMMTHKLGIELSNKIAAIGPVVATLFGDENKPSSPVAAVIFNGLLDKSVQYNGGDHGGRFASSWDNSVPPLAVEKQALFWAEANGCKSEPQKVEDGKLKHLSYHCPDGKDVEMYIVKDNGHAWPGGEQGSSKGDIPSQTINATDIMWDFFKKQSRQ